MLNFRIVGDRIQYGYRDIAIVMPNLPATLMDQAFDLIEKAEDGMMTEREHNKQTSELESGWREDITALEAKIELLQNENTALERELDALIDSDAKTLIAFLREEIEQWRQNSERYRKAFTDLKFTTENTKRVTRRRKISVDQK